MDWTVLQHAAISLLCTLIGWLFDESIAGACFGIALFIGREHAQAEYRWIETKGSGKRSNMPWWGGFDVSVWDYSSLADWIIPVLACVVLLGCLSRWA